MAIGDVTFYPNSINFIGLDYTAEPAMITQGFACSGGETTGPLYDLVDNKRTSLLTVDTNGEATDFGIDFDFTSALTYTFYIIDRHDLNSASADVEFNDAGTPVTPTSAYSGTLGSALSSQTITGDLVIEATDGTLLTILPSGSDTDITFDFTDHQAGNFTADVWMGEICIGAYKTISIAPNINIINDQREKGVVVHESLGGQKYSHQRMPSREAWSLTWDVITASNKADIETVWTITDGPRYPFYIDLGEAATPQLYYVRFMQDTLRFTKLTNDAYTCTINIESEV